MSGQIAGIVLAAGFSRRLGRPKQLVELLGETLLQRAVRTAHEAGLNPLVVVINADVSAVDLPNCNVVVNAEAAEGMASSVRCGVKALESSQVAGAVVMTCDQVAVTPEHLRALCAELEDATGSGYAGKVGVPAYFPSAMFTKLLTLRGDQGARDLLARARCVATEALALDVDTEEELARAEQWLREHGG